MFVINRNKGLENKNRSRTRKYTLINNQFRLCSSTLAIILKKRRRRSFQRSCWVQPELQLADHGTFWETTVPEYTDLRFKKNFRINRATFQYLCSTLGPYLKKQDTIMRQAISVEKRIAIALTFLKGNLDFWTIADLFGIGKSTIGYILYEFCDVLIAVMYSTFVKFPHTEEQKLIIANGFLNKWQFPDCFGALDGTHIPIIAPVDYPEDYYCYKSFHSIVLLALVDSNYKFIYVSIGSPGSCNDASILRNSALFKKLKDSATNKHIIGDAAFPLMPWLMKPYQISNNMPEIEVNFNKRLSSARMTVENSFGRLKGRWRILLKKSNLNLNHIKLVTKACVILHNICEEQGDEVPQEWIDEVTTLENIQNRAFNDTNALTIAKHKRNRLAQTLLIH